MKITVLCVGKIKEKFFRDAIDEYKKRLSAYSVIDIIEVSDEKTNEKASDREISIIKAAEGERLLKRIPEASYVITLEINGKMKTSEELSESISRLMLNGCSHICFIIGGSLGLDERICRRSQLSLSFSKMTFPHQLMRVILLEQVYRAFKIKAGEPYHK